MFWCTYWGHKSWQIYTPMNFCLRVDTLHTMQSWYCTLRCQMTGGFKINGGEISENFNKRVGQNKQGLDFSEKLNNLEGQQSRDHTIRQDARFVEYGFWRENSRQKCTHASVKCSPSNYCFCFGLWFIIGLMMCSLKRGLVAVRRNMNVTQQSAFKLNII